MKRYFTIFVTTLALLFVSAIAETDYSMMTDEELLTEWALINTEVASRNINCDPIIYDGVYYAGEDIKATSFELTALGYNGDYTYILVGVWDKDGNKVSSVTLNIGEKTTVTIKDDYHLTIRQGYMGIVEKKNSFAP